MRSSADADALDLVASLADLNIGLLDAKHGASYRSSQDDEGSLNSAKTKTQLSIMTSGLGVSGSSRYSSPVPSSTPMASSRSSVGDSKTTLWMGDLDPWMDEQYVKQVWANYGEQVNVKIIRDRFTG